MLNIVFNNPVLPLNISHKRPDCASLEILNFHGISEQNRERIVDWILQVLHALNVDVPNTFFAAVSFLDRYLVAKYHKSQSVGAE